MFFISDVHHGLASIKNIPDTKEPVVILGDLINEGLFPMKYKNCQISIDRFSGTIDWYCDWSEDNWRDYREETTYTLATPFWDVNDGIPVDTNSYDGVDFLSIIL